MLRVFLISVLVSMARGQQTCPYRTHGVLAGDVTLGFMFPFRSGDLCESEGEDLSAIQLVEAAIYAVNEANTDGVIPGVTIGLEVWDSCYSTTVATDRGISFLGDRRVLNEQNGGDNCGTQFKAAMLADLRGDRGPSAASLFSDAQLPVISYAATLPDLTTFPRLPYFTRTVPSDSAEAKAVAVLLLSQGWKYVSLVYGDSTEDQALAEAFKAEAQTSKICIARSFVINTGAPTSEIASTTSELAQLTRSRVIVTFLSSVEFFVQFSNLQTASEFQLIAGHRSMDYLLSANSLALDIIIVSPVAVDVSTAHPFDDYFKGLSPTNSNPQVDVWFSSYWESSYNCVIGTSCGPTQEIVHQRNYQRNPYVLSVIDSVKAAVNALKSLHEDKCFGIPGVCGAFVLSTPTEVLNSIRSVEVDLTSDRPISFNSMGNPGSESFVFWSLNTQSGSLGELARSVDGMYQVTASFTGFHAIASTCGNPCVDPSCLSLEDETIMARVDGDILLAGMFAINEFLPDLDDCGPLSPKGVLGLEAMLYAMDQINQDPNILPTVTLGLEGINTCGSPQEAGHQALKLVSEFSFGRSASGSRVADDSTKQHLYGIIGPPSNDEVEAVASVVQTYGVTVVGYEADSHLLSSFTAPNFARVVPTYITSFFTLGDVLEEWNFRYVQVLFSEENYPLRTVIGSYFQRNGVCVAHTLQIPAEDSGWDEIFESLTSKPQANAVLLVAAPGDIQRYMAQIQQRSLIGRYFLIVGDDWVMDDEFIDGFEDAARGAIVVKTSPRQYGDFQQYVSRLDPASNTRNPWFREYWMNRFSCNLPGETSQFMNQCTGNEALDPTVDAADETAAYVIDAVYALAEALHRIHSEVCGSNFPGVCDAMDDLPGDEVFSELLQRTFISPNEDELQILFSFSGDSNIPYHVYNIQPNGPVEIATYERYALTTTTQQPVFYSSDGSIRTTDLYSVCNQTKCLECERNGKDSVATTGMGDVWIGGFFEITEPESTQIECTDTLVLYNMQLLEAFLFAIDQVNDDPTILPDLTLGGIGFDSCGSKKRVGKEVGNFYSGTVDYRPGYNPNRIEIAGMIGGGTSDTTQALSNTLVNLDINTISYGATASMFSSTKMYPHVLRTVPSDEKQAAALADILKHFGWRYISVVYSDDVYGNDILEHFTAAAKDSEICLAMTLVVSKSTSSGQYDSLIDSLQANPQSRVVLLLTSDLYTRSVLQAAERKMITDIQWVGGDTWGSRGYVTEGAETTARGAITLQFMGSEASGFREHFTSLSAYSNTRNPWWRDFWSDTFRCNLITGRSRYDDACGFHLSLGDMYVQAPEVTYVVNAVKALANGLQEAMIELCPGVTNHLCSNLVNDPDRLADIIRGSSFTGADGSPFSFDAQGDGPAIYDILNVQPGSVPRYTTVGSWNKSTLSIDATAQAPSQPTECVGRCDECSLLQRPVKQFASLPGELQIPALVGVHEATAGMGHVCGSLREAGVVNVEAILYAVGEINADNSLLKGVQLGTTIFDSCLSPGRGIGELSSYLSRIGDFREDTTWRYIAGIVAAEDRALTRYAANIAEQYEYIQVAYSPVVSRDNDFLLQTSTSLDQLFWLVQEILTEYGWNFVQLVSDGQDSQHRQLAEAIFDAQSYLDFCVDRFFEYHREGSSNAQRTLEMSEANVVILVMSYDAAIELTDSMKLAKHLTFIVINTYPPSGLSRAVSENLRGAIFVSFDNPSTRFANSLTSLRFGQNSRDPWFNELIANKHGCTADGRGGRRCGSNDRLTDATASVNVNSAIDAVYAIARGIDSVRKVFCGDDFSGLCPEFFSVPAEEIRRMMYGADFRTVDGRTVVMDNGEAIKSFTLWNSDADGLIKMVGSWRNGTLDIKNVYLEDTASTKGTVMSSQSSCTPKKGAVQELLVQSELSQLWFIVVLILAVIGIIIAISCLVGVYLRHHAPQGQVYSVFLTIILLVMITLIFAQNFLFALEPSVLTCALRQVCFSVSITGAFIAVFLLTVRIYRILAREKRITGPRTLYINTKSQARIFPLFLILEILIVAQVLFFKPPIVAYDANNIGYCGYLDVNYPMSLLYAYFLMVAILVVSVLALCRSSTILSREVWLGFIGIIICIIVVAALVMVIVLQYHVADHEYGICIILVAAWIVVGVLQDHVLELDSAFLPATCFLSVALGYLLLLFFVPIRVFNLWRRHDPFSDSASVRSGEFRDPRQRDDNIYNVADEVAVGGQDNHTYDNPVEATAKKLSESKM